ncbi:hypothetical protein L873DRAFT_1804592 [Choiromyces venosus 120613-1]|uniref:Uncharacterized protein n=1 Tax=Choiromyces venosus 120613-1 TaxID=1336337 RepID=A0A3N4K4J1_9PEZI|nr:hypothetical protein L873DRAFT_1804592 [Choiromyces venosus 120613-1]
MLTCITGTSACLSILGAEAGGGAGGWCLKCSFEGGGRWFGPSGCGCAVVVWCGMVFWLVG